MAAGSGAGPGRAGTAAGDRGYGCPTRTAVKQQGAGHADGDSSARRSACDRGAGKQGRAAVVSVVWSHSWALLAVDHRWPGCDGDRGYEPGYTAASHEDP